MSNEMVVRDKDAPSPEVPRDGLLFLLGEDGISVKSVVLLRLYPDGSTLRAAEIMLSPFERSTMDGAIDATLESMTRTYVLPGAQLCAAPEDERAT